MLIVDDNQDAADSLGLLLETMARDVRTVYDGPAALEEARACVPDLALPGLNGQAVCTRFAKSRGVGGRSSRW